MPAPGDGIKAEIDEIGKTFLCNIVTASQKSKNLIQTRDPKISSKQLIGLNLIQSDMNLIKADTFPFKINWISYKIE